MTSKDRHLLGVGLGFLAPNILGFLAFTLFPLVFSLVMAFSNWDLRYHNMFKEAPLSFSFDNFFQIMQSHDFWAFLGNTIFFMLGIPFSVAGSLGLALLLSKDFGTGGRSLKAWLLGGALLLTSAAFLSLLGAGSTAMILVLAGVAGLMLVGGVMGGSTVYRTLCYLPHFTAGVATFILWKKIYSPHTGPLNALLNPILGAVGAAVNALPEEVVKAGFWLALLSMTGVFAFCLQRLFRLWRDGDIGTSSLFVANGILLVPAGFYFSLETVFGARETLAAILLLSILWAAFSHIRRREFSCEPGKGLGTVLMLTLAFVILQFALLGVSLVFAQLPDWAAKGLTAPNWLTDYHWAKPALMIMAFWGAIGSNSMLLYLAGLSNIPQELYEAADIDGAKPFQRFWHVTWPQLAPVTFFIAVMAIISGLQGGFEMAYAMTQGGPAGSTTTLSYFIYAEGFETGRLGYASGVAWTLFGLVFLVTIFNWKFGNRYVND